MGQAKRRRLAWWLRDEGVEIGALHKPLWVHPYAIAVLSLVVCVALSVWGDRLLARMRATRQSARSSAHDAALRSPAPTDQGSGDR